MKALALFLALTASAAAQPTCLSWTDALGKTGIADAEFMRLAEGELAQQLIDFVNMQPPPTQFRGDTAAVYRRAETLVVVIGLKGCANQVIELPLSMFGRGRDPDA